MDIGVIEVVVGLVFTIVGGVIGILGYKRTEKKDIEDEITKKANADAEKIRHDTKIDIKLDNIAKNIDEIRLDNKDFSKTINKISERLGVAENDIRTVKGRVDDLEKLHTK